MSASVLDSPGYLLAFAFLCGVAGFRVGWRIPGRLALPVVQGAFGWTAFALAWTARGPAWAAAAVGSWAVATSLLAIYSFGPDAGRTDAKVLGAADDRAPLLAWLASGQGPESRPLAILRARVHELIVYGAAATLTANAVGLVVMAILLNRTNAWFATLARAARRPWVVRSLGWPPWSLVRLAALAALGAAGTAPVAARMGWPAQAGTVVPVALAGGIGVLLAWVLELTLARWCRRLLREAVDIDAAASGQRPSGARFTLGLMGDPPSGVR